jgi:hypothetical protein
MIKKILLLAITILVLLTSCQPAPTSNPTLTPIPPSPQPPTLTPLPPTPTTPPTGISGTVKYTGPSKGGILIFVMDQPPKQNEAPQPAAVKTFTDVSGEFSWELPPATYYIIAFLTIDRAPEGPPKPNEPMVSCDPIELKANESVIVEVVLTDEAIGGKSEACVKGN